MEGTNADMISVWAFDEEISSLTRVYCSDEKNADIRRPCVRKRSDHEDYFSAILEHICITADYPFRTVHKSLIEGYLAPLGIKSALSHTIFRGNEPVGIICCEAEKPLDWSPEMIAKIRALTVAMGHEFQDKIFETNPPSSLKRK